MSVLLIELKNNKYKIYNISRLIHGHGIKMLKIYFLIRH